MVKSVVNSLLHANRYYEITYAKFNLNSIYLPPYEREIWHYKQANLYWKNAFSRSSETILNIFHNSIPHNAMNCDDRDPPWITKNMKQLITERKTLRSLDKVELATFGVIWKHLTYSKTS